MFELKLYLSAILTLAYFVDDLNAVSLIRTNEINYKSRLFSDNYCDPELCSGNRKHVACANKGYFSHSCTNDARVIGLSDYDKRLLLHMHNNYRNTIAEGRTPRFQPAVRMGALQWDDELAYLAELNAMSCEIEHDKCRNTRSYPFAGQNLALGWLLDDHTIDWAIRNFTSEWYIEYKDCPTDIINRFYRPNGAPIGHFTMMINDKQSRVGCGLVKYTKRMNNYDYKVHVLACNYSWTNIFTFPVYVTGRTASGCTTGTHSYYKGLCSDAEHIKGNYYL